QDANLSLPTEQTVWQVASGSLDEVERLASLVGDAATAMALATSDQRARATAAYEALLVEYRRLGGPGAAARVRQVLAALGLGPTRHADLVASLSAGERQRLALATVLSSAADVLLLDEPTNHLDLSERTWLERHI